MCPALTTLTPPPIITEAFTNATAAVARLEEIYERNTEFLRDHFEAYRQRRAADGAGARLLSVRARHHRDPCAADSRLTYGFVAGPGVYETTLTRPDLFRTYLTEQIRLLLENHGVPVEVGESERADPGALRLSAGHPHRGRASPTGGNVAPSSDRCATCSTCPTSTRWTTRIANGTLQLPPGEPEPLALFPAPRVDYSLHRLRHYTGTDPEHFQNFVLFTNYQFYIDEFVRLGRERMAGRRGRHYDAFVEPGNVITPQCAPRRAGDRPARRPRACRRCRPTTCVEPDMRGITMVNIGVGPANAEDDHRPHRGAAAARLADARPLRRPAQHPAARRLRAGPRLCARGPRARRGPAAVGADPGARRGAGRAGGGGRRGHRARRATS